MVSSIGPIPLGMVVAIIAASAGGVWISIQLARRAGKMDIPNERSSHATPMPRIGGAPMVVTVVLSLAFWVYLTTGDLSFPIGLFLSIVFAFMMSVLGFLDDIIGLSPLLRLVVQFIGAILSLLMFVDPHSDLLIATVVIPPVLWVPVCAIWIVWMLNLYNFMDGIDGLAGGEAVLASSFFFLTFSCLGEPGWAMANLCVACASMGFLLFNWPPARVFMGDTGSAFLGAYYGMQSVVAPITTPIPFVVLALPFSNFILDTTFTLVRRIWRREIWYQAHRSHYYQRMTNAGMSHRQVTILELITQVASCGAAWACIHLGTLGRFIMISVVIIGFLSGGFLVRRKERIINQ